jgi:hypothetical protein
VSSIYSIPENQDIRLWRYLDFAKFVSLLESRSLFFSRSDLLGDRHEFSYPKSNYKAFDGTPQSVNSDFFIQATRVLAQTIFVNCWHMNDHESTAMWDQYSTDDNGLAIQSTFRRLHQALDTCNYRQRLDIGIVRYVDYEQEVINGQNILEFIFHKRIQFSHEKELRAVIWKKTTNEAVIDPFAMTEPDSAEPGLVIPVPLDNLIERIIVAPTAPTWFTKLVESVCARYELKCPITQFVLGDAPFR